MATLMQDYAPLAVVAQEQVKGFCLGYLPYIVKVLRPCLSVTFFSPFLSAVPLIFLRFVTSCVNSSIGIHSTHFETVRKTAQKHYV